MPLKLDIKKKLCSRSERVKCVEIHTQQPWVVAGLYNGNIIIYDYITQAVLKSFEVSNFPIRCAKFIPRMHWLIVGSDDKNIRVYNYNTLDKVKTFQAHDDYIRSVIVHPTLPYILTSSDDCMIKLWDWEKNWEQKQSFEGHGHYVMQIVFNPKDYTTFASASLDRTVKIWGITGTNNAHYSLIGHTQGVNCVEYYPGGDKPYIISGGDDMKIRVWDYQTKQCIHALSGHHHNISSVIFHSDLPLIISTSEDSTVKLWHSSTFRLETTLNYGMERGWAQSCGNKLLAIGFDEGTMVLKLGSDEPLCSMTNTGYIIWVKNNEINSANLRVNENDLVDGETVNLIVKETETCEFFPQYIRHSPNGRAFALCGDGDYYIKSSRAFRSQGYGSSQEFAWSSSSFGDFAIRLGNTVKILRDNEEKVSYKAPFTVENIFGGFLLSVKGDEYCDFVDWESGALIRRINISPRQIYWSESGKHVAIILEETFFILQFKHEAVGKTQAEDDGYPEAFELMFEILENINSGLWLSECFLFTTANNKLNYCLGGKSMTLVTLDKKMFIIGYIAQQNRVYLMDCDRNVISFTVMLSFIEYQISVVQEDFEKAEAIFPSIPENYHNKCAKFLDSLGYKEEAMAITTDKDHKFDLALQLSNLEEAYEIAQGDDQNDSKWKMVGDLALLGGNFDLAESCMTKSKDWNGLLLLYTSIAQGDKIRDLAETTIKEGKMNVAFVCYFLLKDTDKCIDCLVKSGRIPEAAFFARTYAPSRIPDVVKMWKEYVSKYSKVTADSLTDPTEYLDKFPEIQLALKAEKTLKDFYNQSFGAENYATAMSVFDMDFLSLVAEDENIDIMQILSQPPECPDDPFESS
ncbi:hypothetical protein SteCoe_8885 [Stentor coeruleus]|uniref:Coatomer subunit beta' n=1 Tax=Stentor coeruleus TaxID=5963 RepID=A0A1R2CJ53_9CILI|nr:hypothetical protein SteCoe_8885 [Stentor coeruleus]